MSKRVLAIVPARANSQRLPNKNTAELGGLSLVAWALRKLLDLQALLSETDTEIEFALSTDSRQIASEWPHPWTPSELRPAELATKDTSTELVVDHVLSEVGAKFHYVLVVQPTSPLVEPRDLLRLIYKLQEGESSAVLVARWDHPPTWTVCLDENRNLTTPWSGKFEGQDLFRPVGAWAVTRNHWDKRKKLAVPGESSVVEVPLDRGIDIDTEHDLAFAEAILRRQSRAGSAFSINGTAVGSDHPCYIVAEAGVNHNGDASLARELIDRAVYAGADAIKFQLFKASEISRRDAPLAKYQRVPGSERQSQYELLRNLEIPESVMRDLFAYARARGIEIFATAFDEGSLRALLELKVGVLKVPSGELTNQLLLKRIGATRLPVMVSTGMSTMWEVMDAVSCLSSSGSESLAVLHCVSCYPAPREACNLRAMDEISVATGHAVGWSDHCAGWSVAVAAAAAGATIIEKHLTIDKNMNGPDHASSADPEEFKEMVERVRLTERAMGMKSKAPQKCELDVQGVARRSLVVVKDLNAGHRIKYSDLAARRPAVGLSPSLVNFVCGKVLLKRKARGDTIQWADFDA